MKDLKSIIIAILFAGIGLGLGYFLFGNTKDEHEHQKEGQQTGNETNSAAIWTCSMHPQIRAEEKGLCPICEMDLIPLTQNSSDDPLVLEMTETAVALSNIQTTVIGASTASAKQLELSGKIQADERRISNQVSHLSGRIEQLFVTFTGEQIRKGQKLALIYSPELVTAQRELLEALKFQHMNPSLAKAARKKLEYWKIPTETIKKLEDTRQIQETITIFAEQSGVVQERMVAIGDYVKTGQVLFQILNLQKVWAVFDGYEEDLASIRPGALIEFTSPAVPNKTFTTRINFIDPLINAETRVAAIRGEVLNSNGRLKPEQFITGMLTLNINKNKQVTLPKSAVLWTGKRSIVYVKVPDTSIPSFEFREVELGESLGNQYVILDGIEIGEEVVSNGSFSIDAAAQLNNQRSMMNKLVALKDTEDAEIINFKAETPIAFQEQIDQLTSAYLILKDALVATDAAAAFREINSFQEKLSLIDGSLLKGEALSTWTELHESLAAHATKIASSEAIDVQRKQFSFLSEALINTVRYYGTAQMDLYVQHCPMALDDEGADWLSGEAAILNPYFGDKMLKCGLVEEELQAVN